MPTLDSLSRFLSPFEQTQLWQTPDYNQYHLNYEPGLPSPDNGGYSFGTLHDLDQAISNRYGPWSSLPQYVEEAQLQNYETQRAEFEAYIAHSHNAQAPSTGIVYWQLNKGWPTLLWNLYNNDYDQAGSYFGAQEANQSLHAFYAYDSGQVGIANLTGHRVAGLSVRARVYDVAGTLLSKSHSPAVALDGQGVAGDVLKPTVPAPTAPPAAARTYFVELRLIRGRHVVDRNVYWLSTQPDQVDWSKTIGQPQATMTGYADLRQLRQLPAAQVTVSASSHPKRGAGSNRPGRRRADHQHLEQADGRLLPARRPAAGLGGRRAGRRRQPAAARLLGPQRHHPVARRVRDPARRLSQRAARRRLAGGLGQRRQRRRDRRPRRLTPDGHASRVFIACSLREAGKTRVS